MNISGKKCLFDTNILIFARDKTSLRHQKAVELFKDLEAGKFEAFVSYQNLLEFTAVLTRVYKISQKEVAGDLELLLSSPKIRVIYPTLATLPIFLKLLKKDTGVYVYDLYLAATAKTNGIEIIISNDNDFQKIKEVNLFNPYK